MALTTYSDALTQYLENISWRGNLAKATLFLEAIDALDVLRLIKSTDGDGQTMDYASISEKRDEVIAFINVLDPAVIATQSSFIQGKMKS